MCLSVRPILLLLLALTCLGVPSPALAWVETTVVSDSVTVDIERSGDATVAHELVLRVRGGPLKGTELGGVDFDAEPFEDATVLSLGGHNDEPKPLLLSRGDDDTLRIEVNDDKGLRNGTYNFRFRYKTSLKKNSRVDVRGSWAEIDWIGPRYIAGLDVAKVTFRLPYAPTAPRLPEIESSADDQAQGFQSAAMLSNLRRNGEIDELELIRPHVAKGEPVLWRVWVSPATFPWLNAAANGAQLPKAQSREAVRSPLSKALPLLLAGLLAATFALLIWTKARAVQQEAARQQLEPRPLARVHVKWRALGGGLGGAIALLLAVRLEWPTLAAVVWVLALLLSVHLRPSEPRRLRGPGRWLPIVDDDAWQKPRMAQHGRWLDASTKPGKIALAIWLLCCFALVAWCFRREPYYAILLAMGSGVVLPTWLTGCFEDLPWARTDRARKGLCALSKKLQKNAAWKVRVFGRFADGANEPDELRLRVTASVMTPGLLGLELASNCDEASLPPEVSLLVRVTDGSRAHAVYAKTLPFGRGRTPTERVAVVSFAVAASTQLRNLIAELLTVKPSDPVDRNQPSSRPNKPERSAAKGSVTSNPGRRGSPSHATRAA